MKVIIILLGCGMSFPGLASNQECAGRSVRRDRGDGLHENVAERLVDVRGTTAIFRPREQEQVIGAEVEHRGRQ
jgi:hypothetical protein